MNKGWTRERWYEFRTGHSTYLIFVLTFVNFVLISYRLLIEKVSFFKELVPELWIFTLLFLALYIPAAIIIGYWHRHTQLSTENIIKRLEDPFLAHICRIVLDSRTGRASEKEITELKTLLSKIEDMK